MVVVKVATEAMVVDMVAMVGMAMAKVMAMGMALVKVATMVMGMVGMVMVMAMVDTAVSKHKQPSGAAHRRRRRELERKLGLPPRPPYRPQHTHESLLKKLIVAVTTYLYETGSELSTEIQLARNELRKVLDTCECFMDPELDTPPTARVDIEHHTGNVKRERHGPQA